MGEQPKSAKAAAPAEEGNPNPDAQAADDEGGGWKKFIWNSDAKEFLGRTGNSWLLITVFYIIFFISLYCFFMLQWYVALVFIQHDKPFKSGDAAGSMLYRKGPGLTFRPVPDRTTNGDSTLIYFNTGSFDGHKFWSHQLRQWMDNIPSNSSIDRKLYGACNGVADPNFGYDRGEPCILIKLNRVSIRLMHVNYIVFTKA